MTKAGQSLTSLEYSWCYTGKIVVNARNKLMVSSDNDIGWTTPEMTRIQ